LAISRQDDGIGVEIGRLAMMRISDPPASRKSSRRLVGVRDRLELLEARCSSQRVSRRAPGRAAEISAAYGQLDRLWLDVCVVGLNGVHDGLGLVHATGEIGADESMRTLSSWSIALPRS
jgi:hypothetical protein